MLKPNQTKPNTPCLKLHLVNSSREEGPNRPASLSQLGMQGPPPTLKSSCILVSPSHGVLLFFPFWSHSISFLTLFLLRLSRCIALILSIPPFKNRQWLPQDTEEPRPLSWVFKTCCKLATIHFRGWDFRSQGFLPVPDKWVYFLVCPLPLALSPPAKACLSFKTLFNLSSSKKPSMFTPSMVTFPIVRPHLHQVLGNSHLTVLRKPWYLFLNDCITLAFPGFRSSLSTEFVNSSDLLSRNILVRITRPDI